MTFRRTGRRRTAWWRWQTTTSAVMPAAIGCLEMPARTRWAAAAAPTNSTADSVTMCSRARTGPIPVRATRMMTSFFGGLGNDEIFGGAGNDIIEGEGNNDTIWGDDGDDIIRGGGASDEIHGGAGNDLIFGDVSEAGGEVEALETIFGDAGNDTIYAQQLADVIYGGAGNDTIYALAGDDWVDAGIDDDEVFAGTGNDWVVGGFGDDVLSGEDGQRRALGRTGAGEATAADFDLSVRRISSCRPAGTEVETQFPTGFAPPLVTPMVLLGQNVEGRRGDGRDELHGGERHGLPVRR